MMESINTPALVTSFINGTVDQEPIRIPKVSLIAGCIIMTSTSFYLVAVLTTHRIRRRRIRDQEMLALANSLRGRNASVPKRRGKNPGSIRSGKAAASPWLDNLSLVAAVLTFLNCISDSPIVFTSNISSDVCKVMQLFSYVFYTSGHVCLYIFLWIRQRACYKNRSLALLHNKFSRTVSAIILPVFLTTSFVGMILTGVVWSFESSEYGCIESAQTRVPLIVLFAGSITMQVTLLALFIYPLKRHTALLLKGGEISSPSEKLLTNLVKRSIITTSLCVLADTSAFILAMTLDYNLPFIVINYIYNANLICNVISIIGSFADWRKRLGPCCMQTKINNLKTVLSVKDSTTAV